VRPALRCCAAISHCNLEREAPCRRGPRWASRSGALERWSISSAGQVPGCKRAHLARAGSGFVPLSSGDARGAPTGAKLPAGRAHVTRLKRGAAMLAACGAARQRRSRRIRLNIDRQQIGHLRGRRAACAARAAAGWGAARSVVVSCADLHPRDTGTWRLCDRAAGLGETRGADPSSDGQKVSRLPTGQDLWRAGRR